MSGVVIIGAGPAGLGAALALGRDAVVLEGAAEVAGLSRTIVRDGAVFDLGGHSFHTPHPEVRDLVFAALDMEEQRREAWCWRQGEWIRYPFQKHFSALRDEAARLACAADMAAAPGGAAARDFDEFLDMKFGRTVTELFMRPYNQKLWGEDLARLTTDWTGERVAGPAGAAERFAETGGRRTPLQDDTMIAYPAQGGFGEIFVALARRVANLRLGVQVARIDPRRRRLTTGDGETMAWDQLISTMPLPSLLAVLPDVPAEISGAVARLESIPVNLVMVVLEGRGPVQRQRVYCPDRGVPGHKFVLNHTSSAWLRARPRHGIQAEVAGTLEDREALGRRTVADLVRFGLIAGPADVRQVEVLRLPLGYPAPTHERDRIMQKVRAWLSPQGISLAGRFAEWAYINADEAMARGLRRGAALRAGIEPVAAAG